MSLESNQAFAQRWPISFITPAQEEAIRREVAQRELVIDFWEHQEDMRNEQRAYRRERITSAIIACLLSILGVASFIWLALLLGAR